MILVIILLVLAAVFLRGVFRILIPILLGLLLLHFVIGTLFWLLSPHVLIPLLIIAGIVWVWKTVRSQRNRY